uniref:Copia protein n=2 Tax=Cacopsylla melanoneura TaxID=428564 RepID=A0A8D9BGB4_9HEMI
MAQLNKYGLKQFDGTGFPNWEFRLKGVMQEQGVLEMVLGECQEPGTKKNKEKEALARNIIIQSVSDDCLEILKSADLAKEMLDVLKKHFQRNSLSERIHLKKELSSMKFDGKSSMSSFIMKYESLVRQLRDSGCVVDENEKIISFLSTLPKSYENFCTSLDLLISQQSLTFDFVRSRILDEELKKKSSVNNVNSVNNVKQEANAFSVFKFQCYNCGKYGHKRSECRVKKKNTRQTPGTHQSYKPGKPKANYVAELAEVNAVADVSTHEFNDLKSTTEESSISFLLCTEEKTANVLKNDIGNCVEFVIDSGASDHFVNDMKYFNGGYITLKNPIPVVTANDGIKLIATKVGTVVTECFTIQNVLFVKGMKSNLLSVKRIERKGLKVTFEDSQVVVSKGDKIVFQMTSFGKMYMAKFKLKNVDCAAHKACTTNEQNVLWHRRLGHPCDGKLGHLQKEGYIDSVQQKQRDILCETCIKGKQSRLPFKENLVKTHRVLELIHTDLCGPITPNTHDGKKYILTFIDDFTHFTMVYLLEGKNEVPKFVMEYVKMVHAKFNTKISRIRCDNGMEFNNNILQNYYKEEGIKMEVTIPYTPEENGKAERMNRTILEKARTLISEANFEKDMWGESVLTSVYLINRLPTVNNKIPAELWFGYKPNYQKKKDADDILLRTRRTT